MDPNSLNAGFAYPNPLYHRYNDTHPGYYSECKEKNRNYDYDQGLLNSLDNPVQTAIIPNPLYGKTSANTTNEVVNTNSSELPNPKYKNSYYDNGYFTAMDNSAGITTIDAPHGDSQNTDGVANRENLETGFYTDYV